MIGAKVEFTTEGYAYKGGPSIVITKQGTILDKLTIIYSNGSIKGSGYLIETTDEEVKAISADVITKMIKR